ncbi:MAG: bacteriophage N4 adsorption protein B [Acidobacteria bacterium ADurb.Bin340]|nr:MAG: bacteriophage N4 adsorption protein B [Acidobacteria bacterium ADurb.Bin340]
MTQDTRKLGERLVDAELITSAQLQEALRHQRIAGGRMGSNLVALGFITEDVLMDFLAQQTGVPRVDLREVEISLEVLRRVPRRLAEQLNVMPLAVKEPKSLVLAMADPLDLNAIDSCRFASGLNIEPVVVSISQLKQFIPDLYRRVEAPGSGAIEVGSIPKDGLEVPFEVPPLPPASASAPVVVPGGAKYARDPFFDKTEALPVGGDSNPFSFFSADPVETLDTSVPPAQLLAGQQPMVIHARTQSTQPARRIETFQTRTLVLGLIKMLQRRGILGDDELQRFIANLIEAGDLKDEERNPGSGY